jgi:hypothetical protein
MFKRPNVVYLAACAVLASIQYAHDPPAHQAIYAYLWAIVVFSYPLCLGLTRSGFRFLSGMLTLLLMLTISHLFALGLILSRESGGLLHPDTDTIALFGFYCIEPAVAAIIWFPLGYLMLRLLIRRKAK